MNERRGLARLSPARKALIGTTVGQLALLAATPVLTHIAPVRTVALFQLGLAVAIIVQPLATLRLEQVIVVRPLTEATRLARASYRAIIVVAISMLVLALGAALSDLNDAADVLVSGAGTMAGFAIAVVDNASLIRSDRLSTAGIRSALAGAIAAALQICAVSFGGGAASLGAAILVGRLMAAVMTRRAGAPVVASERSGLSTGYGWRRAVPSILSLMVSSCALQGPILIISGAIGAIGGAQVGLAQRVAGVPGSLLAAALSQVVTANLAPAVRRTGRPQPARASIEGVVRGAARRLIVIGVGLAVVLALVGPVVTPIIFGHPWHIAGVLIAILALPFGLQLCAFPMVNVYAMLGAESALLRIQLIRLAAVLLLTTIACHLSTNLAIICAVSGFAISLSYLGLVVGALRAAKVFDSTSRLRGVGSSVSNAHFQKVVPRVEVLAEVAR